MAQSSISIPECRLAEKVRAPIPGAIVLGFHSNGPNNIVNVEDASTVKVLISPLLVEAKSDSILLETNRHCRRYVEPNALCKAAVELLAFSEVCHVSSNPKPPIVGSNHNFVAVLYFTDSDVLTATSPVTYINDDNSLNL